LEYGFYCISYTQLFFINKINNINYGEDIVHQLIVVFNVVKKVCIVAVASLVLVTAFLIANTIKLAIYSRKREIEIMRLVGASNISIKIPFIIEGLFIGIIGAVIPIIITIFGYTTLYDFFGGKLFNSSLATLVAPMPFIYNVSGILLLIGIIVGMIGSYQAVRKYLKI
jgi:cell division transport system permease protein